MYTAWNLIKLVLGSFSRAQSVALLLQLLLAVVEVCGCCGCGGGCSYLSLQVSASFATCHMLLQPESFQGKRKRSGGQVCVHMVDGLGALVVRRIFYHEFCDSERERFTRSRQTCAKLKPFAESLHQRN